jgi:hypothetical protein
VTGQPDTIAPEDWAGPAHLRPGLMRPRPHQLERLAEAARKANPDREPDRPDVVLCRRPIATAAELVALCNGAKLALGISAKTPNGQLGRHWTWWAWHGFGRRGRDGRITESVALRVAGAAAPDRPGGRQTLFLWSRPVPDPRLMSAFGATMDFERPGRARVGLAWLMVAAVLAQLPAPEWTSEYVTAWTTTATGRPEDIPRPMPSAAVKKEIRS